MTSLNFAGTASAALIACTVAVAAAQAPPAQASQRIDLAERLAAGKLRAINRTVTKLQGTPGGVHLSEQQANGLAWIEGTDFSEGTIEVDVRGRDVQGASFVGIAFHRKDDNTYESVYLRPFNFRTSAPARRQHAGQYMALPE